MSGPALEPGWPVEPRATWSTVGRALVTWKPESVTVGGLAAREQLLLDLRAIKPYRRTRTARGPTLESNGAAALADTSDPAKRPWVIRIYYTSMEGRKCYAEFGGLTEPAARACRDRLGPAIQSQVWSVKRPRDLRCPGIDADHAMAPHYPASVDVGCQAESWCACRGSGYVDQPAPKPRHGWRKVVFPSERTEPVEREDDVPHCPTCLEPAHASESDDDSYHAGYHAGCRPAGV